MSADISEVWNDFITVHYLYIRINLRLLLIRKWSRAQGKYNCLYSAIRPHRFTSGTNVILIMFNVSHIKISIYIVHRRYYQSPTIIL